MLAWFIVGLVSLIVFTLRYNKRAREIADKYPGPAYLPFIGNGHQLARGGADEFLKTVIGFWNTYGTRFRVFIGPQLFFALSDPADVEVVLSSNKLIEKSSDYEFFFPWLGTGLLTSKGEKWRKHRKVITPAFHFKILEHFIQVFDSQSNVLVDKLKRSAGGKPFDVYPFITLCALDVICEAAMGVPINAQKDSDSAYVHAVKDMSRLVNERMRNPFKRLDALFYFFSDYKLQDEHLKILHGVTNGIIQERRKILQKNQESLATYTENTETFGEKKKMAFLDLLLLSTVDGKPMTDTDIREEVDTFLFEGHDTTTSAISFALHELAKNQDVQEKLYEEQKAIFHDDKTKPCLYTDLQEMKYMELFVKEALRLYPSVPFLGRRAHEDTHINDMLIPKDSSILILVFNMNRNPAIFPDPEKCIPERFLPDESSKRHPYANVSFSAGSRNCIGQKFATLEMKSTISKIIRNYKILTYHEELNLSADVIMKSANGVKIQIVERPT